MDHIWKFKPFSYQILKLSSNSEVYYKNSHMAISPLRGDTEKSAFSTSVYCRQCFYTPVCKIACPTERWAKFFTYILSESTTLMGAY